MFVTNRRKRTIANGMILEKKKIFSIAFHKRFLKKCLIPVRIQDMIKIDE